MASLKIRTLDGGSDKVYVYTMRQRISSGSPFEIQIGFSRAVRVGSRVLVSGTAPLDVGGASVAPNDPGGQTQRCLEIIAEAVQSLGGRQTDIVRTRIYLTRAQDWDLVGRIHGEFFGLIRPAATCVVVAALLRPEWRVEIEAEAIISNELRIDDIELFDRDWIEARCHGLFHGSTVVSWGIAHEPALLPGLVARCEGERLGFVSYNVEDTSCELVAIEAISTQQGIGTSLLRALEKKAVEARCNRLWFILTNDNLDALRFFQRRGYSLEAVHPKALAESRALKPSIPLTGYYGIPLQDELILEKTLPLRT